MTTESYGETMFTRQEESNQGTRPHADDDPNCKIFIIGTRLVFGGTLLVLGFLGNGATIFVLGREKRKTATTLTLLFLAMADLAVVCSYGTVNWTSAYLDLTASFQTRMKFKYATRDWVMPFLQSTNLNSILLTVVVIWQRYIGVCKPQKAKTWITLKKMKLITLTVSCFALLFYLPVFSYGFWGKDSLFVNPSFAFHTLYYVLYSLVLSYSVSYIIPIVSLCMMTGNLIRAMTKIKFQGSKATAKKEMNVSLIVIVVIFAVCQSFAPVRRIMRWQYPDYVKAMACGGDLYYFAPFEMLSVLFNSSSNFFVFMLCAKGFRQKILAIGHKNQVTPLSNVRRTATTTAGFNT